MSMLIQNVYSYGISEFKQEYIPEFFSYTDLSMSGNYILNLRQKLKKIGHERYILENRSLTGIVLDSLYDISNVLKNKQPRGFNPIITNPEKIHKINIDWILCGNIIITSLPEPLYLTYINTHSINDILDIIEYNNKIFRFGNFISTENAPILTSEGIVFNNFGQMESIGDLLNTTIYITFKTKEDSSGSLLTDNTTFINIESNKLFIKSGIYETPFINILPNTGYCIACIITNNEIIMYHKKHSKSGIFNYIPVEKKMYIQLSNCILINISINKLIHSRNTAMNNIKKFSSTFNI